MLRLRATIVAFTVEDFQDLFRLLEQRPEWRAELRRSVLTDDLVELPSIVRELAQAQARTEQRLDELAQHVDELAQAQARTEQRVGELAQHVDELVQARTEQRMGELAAAVASLVDRVGELHGEALEGRPKSH